MKNLLYKLEEYHRGKWIPLRNQNDKQKTVKIPAQYADTLNQDGISAKLRYVLAEDQPTNEEKGEDAPSMEWTRAELEQFAKDKGIDISDCKNKTEILAMIEA